MSPKDIEVLLAEQNNNIAKLQQKITNYKKSPSDRKTLNYIEAYMNEIDELWKTFQKLDNRFRSDQLLPEDHSYYTDDIYAAIGKKYNDVRTKMESEIADLRKTANTPSTSKATLDDKFALEAQKETAMMNKLLDLIEQLINTSGRSIQYYKIKLRVIEQHYEHVNTLHEKLWTNSAYNQEAYLDREEKITNGIIKIQERIISGVESSEAPTSSPPEHLQLPRIELPKFDGNYLNWRNFFDLFSELVDKKAIPPCQKLLYLKSSLYGEAEGLIHNFATTAENYDIAWTTLKNRYENKRVIVNTLLKKLLAQTAATHENVASLKQLHDTTQECLHSLNNLGVVTDNWDPMLLHILIQRLNKQTHVLWEQSLSDPQALPNLKDFLQFIKGRFQSLEALGDKSSQNHNQSSKNLRSLGVAISNKGKCIICQETHALFSCQAFIKMNPKERLQHVQRAKRCVNCLKDGHATKNCNSSSCQKCGKKHNTMLHFDVETPQNTTNQVDTQVATTAIKTLQQKASTALLSTACVIVTDSKGKEHKCRALLDSGSQANFISKGLFHKLGFRPTSSMIDIEGIGQTKSQTAGRINIQVASTTTGFKQRIEVHVLPKIISVQPTQELNLNCWKIPSNVQLADVKFSIPAEVDLLIGAGLFYSILSIGQISLGPGCPILQNTLFGWIVGGEYNPNSVDNSVYCGVGLTSNLEDNILPASEVFFWSDSMVVINWINAVSSNYHTFVANRISAIQQVSNPQQWHHVRSDQNPADLISRGLTSEKLINNRQWFYGPLFLHGSMTAWPLQPPHQQCHLELRQKVITTTAAVQTTESVFQTIRHQNSLFRLQRVMAYIYRFINKARQRNREIVTDITESSCTKIPPPTAIEMENGLMTLVKLSQEESFTEEIKELNQDKCVHNTSSLSSLSPFLDDKGLIRVGGRLQASNLPFDAKHQMLLAHNHPLTKMVFTNLHIQNLHVGAQALLSIVRQRFWPLRGKNLSRSTIQGCVFCTRARPKLFKQLMGALPKDRIQPARPFITAGVDFFGPVWVYLRIRGKQPLKAYVAVFCCFSTKAVHLELVSDLSTDAFLGALRRFMARRGNCSKLYCDNATNFVGAKNQLNELKDVVFHETAQQKIYNECGKRNIEFCFIPPRAPHFGGLWEAAVKSAKNLLQSTISSVDLTREEMETLLAEAEAIMNSRPLTPMSSDPNDLTALTPGHFLIGEPLTSTVDPHAHQNNLKPVGRWKVITHLKMEFWKRWTNEYLHTLQHRYKWKKEVHDIKPNTMVLIKEDNLPSLKWSLGRIEKVIRGEDGLIRVADVKTANNIIRRPISKLAPLPIENEFTEDNEQSETIEENDKPHASKRPKLTN